MDPRPKLRIDAGELFTAEVDESLARQQSFGMAAAVPRAPDRKASLLYRPWLVLMIAGTLGALAGWAVTEPFFDDGLRFEGRVDQRLAAPPGALHYEVSGIRVAIYTQNVKVLGGGGEEALDLEVGAHVRLLAHGFRRGEIPPGAAQPQLWASEVERLPGEAPAGKLSIGALQMKLLLMGVLIFPVIAAFVGLLVAAADGLLSRAWRRAAVCALVGLACGLALGLAASVVGEVLYMSAQRLLHGPDDDGAETVMGFLVQMVVRGFSWAITGATMGLGQGIALRSKRMVLNGLVGGVVGSLLGGLLFDPIHHLVSLRDPLHGAELSRAIGFAVIGLTTGLMIGVVELLSRDAWLKMLIGPLAGKEFVLFKNPTVIGSSPKADIYLFKDAEVEPAHALLHAMGDGYEVEDRAGAGRTLVNGRPVRRARLENGDQLRIGRTVLSFGIKET